MASRCDSNKIPLSSMAKIFGPAIVGHASPNPKDDAILADTKKQPVVTDDGFTGSSICPSVRTHAMGFQSQFTMGNVF